MGEWGVAGGEKGAPPFWKLLLSCWINQRWLFPDLWTFVFWGQTLCFLFQLVWVWVCHSQPKANWLTLVLRGRGQASPHTHTMGKLKVEQGFWAPRQEALSLVPEDGSCSKTTQIHFLALWPCFLCASVFSSVNGMMTVSTSASNTLNNWSNYLPFQAFYSEPSLLYPLLYPTWVSQHGRVFLFHAFAQDIFSSQNTSALSTEIQPILQKPIQIPSPLNLLQISSYIFASVELTFIPWAIFPITSYLLLSCIVMGTWDSSLYLRANTICIVIVSQES